MQSRTVDMPPEGIQLTGSLEAGRLPELMALTRQGECLFQAPIDVRLFITPVAGMFRVEGKLRTVLGLTCSRCLEAFDHDLTSHFHVTYTRERPGSEAAESEDWELKAEDMGLVAFEGETIDFRDAIQEQVILSIPMQPRCRDDCRGLCARCGANLNQAPCNCRSDDVDPRLAVLKNLKLDK
jgi:uncharacterized protein